MVTVKTWAADDVFHVRLNRPEKANAYNGEMLAALREAFRNVPDAKALVISGEGRNFCSGADLRWIHEQAAAGPAQAQAAAREIFAMYEALLQVNVPVFGEVQGNVFGGGVGLTAACDQVVAAPGTVFCLSEVRWAMIPGIIAPIVERKLGKERYESAARSGAPFDAETAARWGLVQPAGNSAGTVQQRRAFAVQFQQRREELIAATSSCWVTPEAMARREKFLST